MCFFSKIFFNFAKKLLFYSEKPVYEPINTFQFNGILMPYWDLRGKFKKVTLIWRFAPRLLKQKFFRKSKNLLFCRKTTHFDDFLVFGNFES